MINWHAYCKHEEIEMKNQDILDEKIDKKM